MVANGGYIRTVPGILKCVTIGLQALLIAVAYAAILGAEYVMNRDGVLDFIGDKTVSLWREICLLATSVVCFVASLTGLLVHVSSKEIYWNKLTALIDFLYHSVALLLLGASGVITIVSDVKLYGINCTSENGCQNFELKLLAGGLAMITALICGVTGVVILTNRKEVERDGLLDEK